MSVEVVRHYRHRDVMSRFACSHGVPSAIDMTYHSSNASEMTSMSRTGPIAIAALMWCALLCAGTARAQARDSVSALSGCYALELGQWSRPTQHAGLPDTIQLDTARAVDQARSSVWRVLSPPGSALRAYWVPTSQNRVRLIWERESGSGAASGDRVPPQRMYVSIIATIEGASLRGTARGSLFESLTPPPSASVRGHRIECPPGP